MTSLTRSRRPFATPPPQIWPSYPSPSSPSSVSSAGGRSFRSTTPSPTRSTSFATPRTSSCFQVRVYLRHVGYQTSGRRMGCMRICSGRANGSWTIRSRCLISDTSSSIRKCSSESRRYVAHVGGIGHSADHSSFAKQIYPSNFTPSPCHRWIKMLENRGIVRTWSSLSRRVGSTIALAQLHAKHRYTGELGGSRKGVAMPW